MRTLIGPQKYDRTQKGALIGPSGTEFPASPEPLEWFLRTDLDCYYYWNGTSWVAVTPDLSSYLTEETDPTVPAHVKAIQTTDITNWDSKESAIAPGTTAQYYRGDKSFQTLDTSAVPENSNLYHTEARVRGSVSGTTPIEYNSTTGVISHVDSDSVRHVTDAEKSTWNAAQNNTASNRTGTGEGLFYQKTGSDLEFKRIDAGTGISLISDNDKVTLSSTVAGGAQTLALYTPSLISDQGVNVYDTSSTWGGLLMIAADNSISALRCWCTQASGSGDVQGAIYNASTNARIAVTSSVAVQTTGLKVLDFSSDVSLVAGNMYYFAIACTGNGSMFAGMLTNGSNFNPNPKPAFREMNNRLPATLNPSYSATVVWIGSVPA
jgi:hypothetical protein